MIRKAHRPLGLQVCGAVVFALVVAAGSRSLAKEHPPIPAQATQVADKNSAATGGVCTGCHKDKLNQPEKHPAVELAGCEGCHEASQKDGKWNVKLTVEGNDLCFQCHDDKKPPAKPDKARRHPPTVEGECVGCHDPHGSKQKFMLQGSVELDNDNLCFTCHSSIEDLTKKKTLHPAVAMGCLTCHQTHKSGAADEQEFGFHLVKGAPSLCLQCHDEKDKDLIKSHAGQPFQTANCTGCHNPHGSDRPKLIRANSHPPFEDRQCDVCHQEPKNGKVVLNEDGKKELCFMCHDDKKELLEKAKVKHGYFDIDDTCTTCHSPHASDQPKRLRKPIREMCGTCHDDEAAKKVAEHRPLESDKACATCHEPHASDFPLHLRANVDDVCLTCHGAQMGVKKQEGGNWLAFGKISLPTQFFEGLRRIPIKTPSERGHPYSFDKGHPVSGENNLKPNLGEITCVSCHSPHGIDEGKKMLKITGNKLCMTCHGDDKKPGSPGKTAEVKK